MSDTSETLLHICTLADWLSVRESPGIEPESLSVVGFVHLSTPAQVHLPANRLFAGRDDLILLVLDPARLGSPVRWEPGVPGDPDAMVFPHLYGPLPTSAVTSVVEYLPGDDGTFTPPHL
ncbi:DUF952 domain-containing protein [Rhodococcoides fascians]|uniref:DUF952 domain-containing protein n=1 Tax=Rhodococcoides fascians TaxID=1828 RepID=UPI000563A398|nr:DUF952 domain-containing protein [Rhodococcus fascians]